MGRTKRLNIFGPTGIKDVMNLILKLGNSWIDFEINYVELKEKTTVKILENDLFSVSTIPLKHRIYTNGFLFTEKIQRKKLKLDKIKKLTPIQTSRNNYKFSSLKKKKDHKILKETKILHQRTKNL